MKISRRTALIGMGVGLLVPNIFSGCFNSRPQDLEEFVNFPENIPGVERVDKYPVFGANHCLVHIRQSHHIEYNPHDPIDKILGEHKPTKKELERINSHQKEIYTILEYLKEQKIIDSVYIEGIDASMLERIKKISLIPEDEEITRELKDLEQKVNQKIIWNVPKGYTPEKLMQEYQQKIEAAKKRLAEHNERYKHFYGAGLRLVLEGKLEPRFENLELNNKAYEEIKRTGKGGVAVFDDREDDILNSIAKETEIIAVVEFGGAHAWGGKESCWEGYSLNGRKSFKDNIAEWNKQHPNQKFCLIEITPKGYGK